MIVAVGKSDIYGTHEETGKAASIGYCIVAEFLLWKNSTFCF